MPVRELQRYKEQGDCMKLVTFTTIGAARLACNWLESVRRLDLDELAHVYCADDESMAALCAFVQTTHSRAKIHALVGPQWKLSHEAIDFGTPDFASLELAKLVLQQTLNDPKHFEPYLFCDADTVLLHDPRSVLEAMTDAHLAPIWTQSDAADESRPSTLANSVNPGVHYCLVPVPILFAAAFQWLTENMPGCLSGQVAFCRALEQTGIRWEMLSPVLWRNGQQDWGNRSQIVLVHANWLVGTLNKEKKLKAEGCWFADVVALKACGLSPRVNLLTSCYHESNLARLYEYQQATAVNLQNPYIDRFIVFNEEADQLFSDVADSSVLQGINLRRRATYADFFDYAARELAGSVCIVANADVSFDETLEALEGYQLEGKLLCISREDNFVDYSQDAWIFHSPLPRMNAGIELGRPGCDNRIAYEAAAAGLQLENPCYSIRVRHHHESNVRNYREEDRVHGSCLYVPPCKLGLPDSATPPVLIARPGLPSHMRNTMPPIMNLSHQRQSRSQPAVCKPVLPKVTR